MMLLLLRWRRVALMLHNNTIPKRWDNITISKRSIRKSFMQIWLSRGRFWRSWYVPRG
jgi:hypothetical protein